MGASQAVGSVGTELLLSMPLTVLRILDQASMLPIGWISLPYLITWAIPITTGFLSAIGIQHALRSAGIGWIARTVAASGMVVTGAALGQTSLIQGSARNDFQGTSIFSIWACSGLVISGLSTLAWGMVLNVSNMLFRTLFGVASSVGSMTLAEIAKVGIGMFALFVVLSFVGGMVSGIVDLIR